MVSISSQPVLRIASNRTPIIKAKKPKIFTDTDVGNATKIMPEISNMDDIVISVMVRTFINSLFIIV